LYFQRDMKLVQRHIAVKEVMAMEKTGVIIDIPSMYNFTFPIDDIGELERFGKEMFTNDRVGVDGKPRNRQEDFVRIE
jgi:hypothetical protein